MRSAENNLRSDREEAFHGYWPPPACGGAPAFVRIKVATTADERHQSSITDRSWNKLISQKTLFVFYFAHPNWRSESSPVFKNTPFWQSLMQLRFKKGGPHKALMVRSFSVMCYYDIHPWHHHLSPVESHMFH